MAYKKFSKSLYNKNDAKAKNIAIDYYESVGWIIEQNPDKYGPDLIATYETGEFAFFVECEIKHNWKTSVFPFTTVQFPERKKKFAELGTVLFFMLNSPCTKALQVPGSELLKAPLVEVSNKYVSQGEKFFQVSVKKVIFIDL